MATGNREEIKQEIGDLLFMTVNLSRFLDVHPEDALESSMAKFSKRFGKMEELTEKDGRALDEMQLDEMEEYWERAKKSEIKP